MASLSSTKSSPRVSAPANGAWMPAPAAVQISITRARVALGGVAARPWRLPEAEALLEGEAPSEALFGRFADRLLAGAEGQGENDFKIPLARRTLVAVLTEATSGARAA